MQNADGVSRREYEQDTDEDVDDDGSFPLIGADFEFVQTHTKPKGKISALTTKRLKKQPRRQVSTQLTDSSKEVLKSTQNVFQHDQLQQMQEQDKQFMHIREFLQFGTLPNDSAAAAKVLKLQNDYFLHDGILYHVWIAPGKGPKASRSHVQLVIPSKMVQAVLSETHDAPLLGGHMGIARTMDKTRLRFYWPTMHKDIVNWIKSCEPCSKRKHPKIPVRAQLIPMPVPTYPFERVSTDILGPLPRCQKTGNRFVLVFIDFSPNMWN